MVITVIKMIAIGKKMIAIGEKNDCYRTIMLTVQSFLRESFQLNQWI